MVNTASRITASLLGGVLISVALLWLMQQMVSGGEAVRVSERERPVMEFVRLKRTSETRLKQREKPQEPPPEAKAPPTKAPEIKTAMPLPVLRTPKIMFSAPNLPVDVNGPYIGPVSQGPPDRDFMAITRVPPRYPYMAERKGIEGWVKLSFLITKQGHIRDVILVDSQPKKIFNNAAIRAIMRWKFKPRMLDGKPVAVRAEQIINFRMGGV